MNLLYVAVTRAKKQIYLNNTVLRVLAKGKEMLFFPSIQVRFKNTKLTALIQICFFNAKTI